jgi:hypothetical protein
MFRTRWPCPRLFGAFRPPRSKHVRIRFAEAQRSLRSLPLTSLSLIFAQRNFFSGFQYHEKIFSEVKAEPKQINV